MPWKLSLINNLEVVLSDSEYQTLKETIGKSSKETRFLVLEDGSFLNVDHITATVKLRIDGGEIVGSPTPEEIRLKKRIENEEKTKDLDSVLKTVKDEDIDIF